MKARRVVTGHNNDGRSVVKWDSELESKPGRERFEKCELWATDSLPAHLTEDDPTAWDVGTSLANGSIFRLCRYEPGVAERWHRTDSLDYGIVISGDIVIQRGTIHNWVNRGTEPCVMAFILIATEGGASTGW